MWHRVHVVRERHKDLNLLLCPVFLKNIKKHHNWHWGLSIHSQVHQSRRTLQLELIRHFCCRCSSFTLFKCHCLRIFYFFFLKKVAILQSPTVIQQQIAARGLTCSPRTKEKCLKECSAIQSVFGGWKVWRVSWYCATMAARWSHQHPGPMGKLDAGRCFAGVMGVKICLCNV